MSRWAWRATAAGVGAAATLAVAGIAYAHVEVEADNPSAGASNVTVTFDAEAENSAAGIATIRVVLPAGIAPANVSLVEAPQGWQFTATDDGYQVAGAAQPTGQAVEHKVKIKKLPDAAALTFKTLVTYGNGEVDRWIGDPGSENPAPVLALANGPMDVVSVSPVPGEAGDGEEGGTSPWWWVLGAAVLVAAFGAGLFALRRRNAAP
jgi:uncharacterized protein YcnI